jgi:hypothetical protein
MTKKKAFFFLLLGALIFIACSNPSGGGGSGSSAGSNRVDGGGDGDDDGVNYREMVSFTGVSIPGNGSMTSAFRGESTTILSPYKIAKYETTWELWDEVRSWAVENRYTFGAEGTQGHGEETGTGNESLGWTANQRKRRAVTNITWRDAMIWCNAYTEKYLGPDKLVYYDAGLTYPLRDSTDILCDSARIKPGGGTGCPQRLNGNAPPGEETPPIHSGISSLQDQRILIVRHGTAKTVTGWDQVIKITEYIR